MNNEKIAKFKQIKIFIPFIIVAVAFIGVGLYVQYTNIYAIRNWNSIQGEVHLSNYRINRINTRIRK